MHVFRDDCKQISEISLFFWNFFFRNFWDNCKQILGIFYSRLKGNFWDFLLTIVRKYRDFGFFEIEHQIDFRTLFSPFSKKIPNFWKIQKIWNFPPHSFICVLPSKALFLFFRKMRGRIWRTSKKWEDNEIQGRKLLHSIWDPRLTPQRPQQIFE